MTSPVNGGARNRRSVETEALLVDAARTLFVAQGWRATTLADVAAAAGVAPRTVYVRFGTKAALFLRVMDVAVAGDTAATPLAERDWMRATLEAPTRDARVAALAAGATRLLERLGPLLPAARDAEADDPEIAARAQAAREDTARHNRTFWTSMARDGLLAPGVDVPWVIATTTLLGAADTYLLMTRTLAWSPRRYRRWMRETWTRFAVTAAAPAPAVPAPTT